MACIIDHIDGDIEMNPPIHTNTKTVRSTNDDNNDGSNDGSKSFTLELQLNPMHTQNVHTETSTTPIPTTANHELPLYTQIAYRLRASGLFVLTIFAFGGILFSAQALAKGASTDAHIDNSVTLWWHTDLMDLVFLVASISAITHFSLNVTGGSRFPKVSIGILLFVWMVLICVTGTITSSYQRILNQTKELEVDRGGCHSVVQRNKEIPVLDACFAQHLEEGADLFVQYRYNRTLIVADGDESKITALTRGLEILAGLADTIELTAKQNNIDGLGFESAECTYSMVDFMCQDLFPICQKIDCASPSHTCFANLQATAVHTYVSCVQTLCMKDCNGEIDEINCVAQCAKIDAANLAKVVDREFPVAVNLLENVGFNKGELQNFRPIIVDILKQSSIHSNSGILPQPQEAKCNDWSTASIGSSSKNKVQNSVSDTHLTCNPKKLTFLKVDEVIQYDNGVLLFSVVMCCTIIAMTLGSKYETFHGLRLSTVRIGSFLAGVLMGTLVYIGAFHLQQDAKINPNEDTRMAQMIWRAIYLMVSFLCIYGGLMVVAPPPESQNDDNNIAKTKTDHSSSSPLSICCERCSCCDKYLLKSIDILKALKAQFWDASGQFFWLKLVCMEVLEISIQLNSFKTSATSSHVDEVSLSAYLIAANLIVLPLVILVVPYVCQQRRTGGATLSNHAVISTVMVVEVLFDKLYVGVAVLLRYNTLINREMDFMEQLSVHGALLLPALVTALDVQDALDLSDHMDTLLVKTRSTRLRSSLVMNLSNNMDQILQHRIFLIIQKIGLVVSIMLGMFLVLFTGLQVDTTNKMCKQKIGSIASCAVEKFYFGNGFFGKTTCEFVQVKTFDCLAIGTSEQSMDFDTRELPDADEEWALMTNLTLINVTDSLLEKIPTGWARIPNKFSVDISKSANFSGLPFLLCSSKTNLTGINLDETRASVWLNWTGQLQAANVSNYTNIYMNAACRNVLEKSLTTLLLGSNGLKFDDLKNTKLDIPKFSQLTRLDLQYNNIANIKISITDTIFLPIVDRFVTNNTLGGVSVSLANNPVTIFSIVAGTKKSRSEWANVICSCTDISKEITVRASIWTAEEIGKIAAMLPQWTVPKLDFYNNKIDDDAMKLLTAALPNSMVRKVDVGYNNIGDESVKALAASLGKMNYLTHLYLTGNEVGDEGAMSLIAALSTSKILYLQLDRNRIGVEGQIAADIPCDNHGYMQKTKNIDGKDIKISMKFQKDSKYLSKKDTLINDC